MAGMKEVLSGRRLKLRRLLRAIRRERGVTQVQLAERLEVPQSRVSKYENGDLRLDLVEVEAVCEALGTSLRSLVRRWDSTPDDFEGD